MELIIYSALILTMYFLAGIDKIMNFNTTVKGFKKMFFIKKLPNVFYQLAILLVIIIEVIAPIVILYSIQTNTYDYEAYISSISLAIFTVLATLIYHFPPKGGEYYPFIKNLTATGGLLLLSTVFQ